MTEPTKTCLTAWAIGEMDHGIDGRGAPTFIPKKIYETKEEAEEHVFEPFMVKMIEIEINQELDKLAKRITPQLGYLLRQYRGDAIVAHLLGKGRIGHDAPSKSEVTQHGEARA